MKTHTRRKKKRISKPSFVARLREWEHRSLGLFACFVLLAFGFGVELNAQGFFFWKTTFASIDPLITYTGVVTPVELVPDYSRWSTYGGNADENTFEQVPSSILIPLPTYTLAVSPVPSIPSSSSAVFTVGYEASYDSGWDKTGGHAGVDIRLPMRTPIRSIANGVVERVGSGVGGFGKYVVIRHPHVPDPDHPGSTTVLHSVYAHLDQQIAQEGQIVGKGQRIALSGKTGLATGPHLYFQIDRDSAPFHPYWPFTGQEARDARMSFWAAVNAGLHAERIAQYTVHPMLFVESQSAGTVVAEAGNHSSSGAKPLTAAQFRAQRIAERRQVIASASSSIRSVEAIATTAAPVQLSTRVTAKVASVAIQSEYLFTDNRWKTVRLSLVDEHGGYADPATLKGNLYLRTAYGEAVFMPSVLRSQDFKNGTVTVKMKPVGRRTVVILVQPLGTMSPPIRYAKGN